MYSACNEKVCFIVEWQLKTIFDYHKIYLPGTFQIHKKSIFVNVNINGIYEAKEWPEK